MEYLKIFLPFIVGVSTAPIIESIKRRLSDRRSKKVVETEFSDFTKFASEYITELMDELINSRDSNGNVLKYILTQIYWPKEFNLIFTNEKIKDIYLISSSNRRNAIRSIMKIMEKHDDRIERIKENKEKFKMCQNIKKEIIFHSTWTLYYQYLADICFLKHFIDCYFRDEEPKFSTAVQSIVPECNERNFDYNHLTNAAIFSGCKSNCIS